MLNTIRVGDLNVLQALPDVASHPPVLFIHGYFVDATVWTTWLERFASHGIPAYAVHLRGRAGSRPSVDLGRVSIEDFADDAALIARHVGAAAVVGHSMGGLIAQKVAERGEAGAVVLITPAPPRGISVLSLPLVMRQLRYFPAILLSRPVRPGREDLRALVLNRVPVDEQHALLDLMIPDSGRAGRDMSLAGVPVNAERVKCPVLVVTAEDDRFVPPRVVARVAERYGAPLLTIPAHGHMVIREPEWQDLADRVERWILAQV